MRPDVATHPADAVAQHYEQLTRLLARHAGSSDAARELLHDTWLRLARTPSTHAATAPAYAYAAARNLLVDQYRHQQMTQSVEAGAASTSTPHIDTTLHSAAHRQALSAVEGALEALPQRTREIFLQHRLLEVPQTELAQRHGVSLATVEREVTRGAAAAQAALDRWQGLPQRRAPASARRRGLGALLGIAGLLSGGVLWRLWQQQVPQWQMAWRTQRGQQVRHPLPDGSQVTLDAQTTLEAGYFGDRRQLRLTAGAAFFDVVHDPDRPFIVDCGAVRVTVLGTRFAVERQGAQVRVEVERGRVRVSRDGAADAAASGAGAGAVADTVELGANEGLIIDAQTGPVSSRVQHLGAAAAPWRDGRLSFDATPLADILTRLSRYYLRSITVDPRVAAWPLTAEIRIALADSWLRHVLPQTLPVQAIDTADGIHITPRR
jgi:transmembrane sensor